MSIADKLTQLTTIRGDIRTALAGKGVTATDHDFADFSADIEAIPSGGGAEGIGELIDPEPMSQKIICEVN